MEESVRDAKYKALLKRSRAFFPFCGKYESSLVKAYEFASKIRFSKDKSGFEDEHIKLVERAFALCFDRHTCKLEIELMASAMMLDRLSKTKPWRNKTYWDIRNGID